MAFLLRTPASGLSSLNAKQNSKEVLPSSIQELGLALRRDMTKQRHGIWNAINRREASFHLIISLGPGPERDALLIEAVRSLSSVPTKTLKALGASSWRMVADHHDPGSLCSQPDPYATEPLQADSQQDESYWAGLAGVPTPAQDNGSDLWRPE